MRSEGAMWGTPRKSPGLVWKVRIVYRLLVMWRRPSRSGRRTISLRKRPGLQGWTWLTWWRAYRRKWSSGQSPDMVAPEGRRFLLSPGWSGFTSPPVPMFAGKISLDQYRQVLEAIVSSNGWDGVTWPCWCRHPGGCCRESCWMR